MSNVSRGNALERKAQKELEAEGFLVEKPVRTRFNRKDFFNCFDLLAVWSGTNYSENAKPRFIQVTVRAKLKERYKKIKDFPKNAQCYTIELWGWDDKAREWDKRDYST